MTKKVLERGLVALLFITVLVVFFFAERDSKKLDRLYPTVYLLKSKPADVASKHSPETIPVN